MPVLETDRLIIRPPSAADTAAMLGFFAEERSEFYGGPLDAIPAWAKFSSYVGQWTLTGYGMFSLTKKGTGETIGMAGPYHPAGFDEPEMSWLLTSAEHEGKGYCSEACRAILGDAFPRHGWSSLVSFIDPRNTASETVARKLGATPDPDTISPLPGCVSYRHFP